MIRRWWREHSWWILYEIALRLPRALRSAVFATVLAETTTGRWGSTNCETVTAFEIWDRFDKGARP